MKLWTIWVQAEDGATWLEAAWDDDSTAENRSGYEEDLTKAEKTAEANNGHMRVIAVNIDGAAVYRAFAHAEVEGAVVDAP